jgi:putative endonuclease
MSIKPWWGRLTSLFSRREIPLGQRGEQVAALWLERSGYRILERNRKLGDDEADLIALDPDRKTIVIVEVKSRAGATAIPELQVTPAKQRFIARLASRLQRLPAYRDRPFRFDVVAVLLPESGEPIVRHHPGAFTSPW